MYTIAEAAKRLGLSPFTVQMYVHYGRIRSVKQGRRRLIPEDAIHEYLLERGLVEDTSNASPDWVPPGYRTVRQAADELQVSEETIRWYLRTRRYPRKLGRGRTYIIPDETFERIKTDVEQYSSRVQADRESYEEERRRKGWIHWSEIPDAQVPKSEAYRTMTISEAAEYLGITKREAFKLLEQGYLDPDLDVTWPKQFRLPVWLYGPTVRRGSVDTVKLYREIAGEDRWRREMKPRYRHRLQNLRMDGRVEEQVQQVYSYG